jgi:hypothetical protein
MTKLSAYDRSYLDRHSGEFDEFIDYDDMPDAWRQYIEIQQGHTTHRSRGRIKSVLYDWQWINAWMTRHRMSNSNLAHLLNCSSGTIANIRSGHYTGKPMIKKVNAIIMEGK